MKVAMCVSEAVPFAKTGGLADVAGALPQALKKAAADAIVVMPGYDFIFKKNPRINKIAENISVEINDTLAESFDLYKTSEGGVDFYFARNDKFFAREYIYGTSRGDYGDNNLRFGFFSKAIFKILEKISYIPDIIHLHDYHLAIAALFLRDMKEKNPGSAFKNTKTVFTIHNIAYQGIFEPGTLNLLNIDYKYFNMDGIEFYGKLNFMKAGIVYSDSITTVSPTYAKEILTPRYAYGLEGILNARSNVLSGIINGIDYNVWNPQNDSFIKASYSIDDISGKQACKDELLLESFNIKLDPGKRVPVLGMVSRLSEQKGIDLIVGAMDKVMEDELFLIILGTGDEKYQMMLEKLGRKYSSKFFLKIGYSDEMSHKIYAGADIFIMPSAYEPCGLGQLISLKYGTIPVVRNTGGLSDTIIDAGSKSGISKGAQGFKFDEYSPKHYYAALKRSLDFYSDSKAWNQIVLNGLKCDFSWDYSAGKYLELYRSLV